MKSIFSTILTQNTLKDTLYTFINSYLTSNNQTNLSKNLKSTLNRKASRAHSIIFRQVERIKNTYVELF
jgi:hypothetical protein